jgi:hypothetical protein
MMGMDEDLCINTIDRIITIPDGVEMDTELLQDLLCKFNATLMMKEFQQMYMDILSPVLNVVCHSLRQTLPVSFFFQSTNKTVKIGDWLKRVESIQNRLTENTTLPSFITYDPSVWSNVFANIQEHLTSQQMEPNE